VVLAAGGDYPLFLTAALLNVAATDEKEEIWTVGLGFSFFGFLFSRLPFCSRLATVDLLRSNGLSEADL
jgi:hypothetical protein